MLGQRPSTPRSARAVTTRLRRGGEAISQTRRFPRVEAEMGEEKRMARGRLPVIAPYRCVSDYLLPIPTPSWRSRWVEFQKHGHNRVLYSSAKIIYRGQRNSRREFSMNLGLSLKLMWITPEPRDRNLGNVSVLCNAYCPAFAAARPFCAPGVIS